MPKMLRKLNAITVMRDLAYHGDPKRWHCCIAHGSLQHQKRSGRGRRRAIPDELHAQMGALGVAEIDDQ